MTLDRPTILHRKDERGVIVESKVFSPGDEVPDDFGAVEYVKVHRVTAHKAEVATSRLTPWKSPLARGTWVSESTEAVEQAAEADETLEAEADGDPDAPPQGGPGSGKQVWADYAAANGVVVDEDDTRDDIIAACKAAGVPVD